MTEMLLILGRGRTLADIEARVQVRQRYGDRVLVVSTDVPDRLHGLDGVKIFGSGVTAPEPAGDFSETEKLGIAAWNARDAIAKKKRLGEGLAWDVKGFKAP